MKIAINSCFGGFKLNDNVTRECGFKSSYDVDRTDLKLIKLIESGVYVSDINSSRIRIISIPDESTDWHIIDYDGAEDVIYVLDGKIHWAGYE